MLYVGTQLIASVITMVGGDKTQQRIMFALPFVFVIFIINFQAGLIVYWITTNVWTIGQQLRGAQALSEARSVLAETGHGAADRGRRRRRRGPSRARGEAAPPSAGRAAATARRAPKPRRRSPRKKKKRSGRRR